MSKIDLNKIRERLTSLQSEKKKQSSSSSYNKELIWKPEADGKYVIRIVPYAHDTSMPFIELLHYYNLKGKIGYLSPASFGDPDPILEFTDKLKQSSEKEDRKLAYGMQPKLRTYAPVLVRGEEEKGVRFWGFGKTVYEQLLTYMADDDYGDITDLSEGRDITIEYVAPTRDKSGKVVDFGKTTLIVKPKQTKVTTDPAIIQLIKEQPAITDAYSVPTYEELEEALQEFLSPDKEEVDTANENEMSKAVDELFKSDDDDAPTVSSTNDDVEHDLDKLFSGN